LNSLSVKLLPVLNQDHMSDEQLGIFKNHLMDEKEKISNLIESGADQLKSGQVKQSDEADAASQFEELTLTLNNRQALVQRLTLIDLTLSKIAKADYGFCDSCGIEININRLAANPISTSCIDCQTVSELKGQSYQQAGY